MSYSLTSFFEFFIQLNFSNIYYHILFFLINVMKSLGETIIFFFSEKKNKNGGAFEY